MTPHDWIKRPLGEVAEFVNGRGFKPHEWSQEGLPIIRIQNLNGSNDFNYYNGSYDPKIEVQNGDLLFAWSGSRGTSFGPHYWFGCKAVLNYHTWRVVVSQETVDKSFMFFALQLLTVQIEDEAHGAAGLVHTQKNKVELYKFSFPPIPEQKAIAAVLSTWDRGIRQRTDLIAAKLRFKQGLMQQLLTGKRRFKGCRDEWSSVQLRNVTTECEERNRGSLGVDSVMAVTKAEGIIPMRERTIGADIARYLIVQKNWFAYNPMRINIGSIARWHGDRDILVSPDYVVFRCNDSSGNKLGIDPDYLDHLRRSGIWEKFVTAAG
ncbi:MAG: restriction endonuclease subunit S, partial [Planctomycetota bacterium]